MASISFEKKSPFKTNWIDLIERERKKERERDRARERERFD
jgi:hypothetical protein